MIVQTANVIDLKRRLYQRIRDFEKFENINEERQEELRRDISYLTATYKKLDLYIKMLEFLTSKSTIHYTFDEKIFSLIEACDPDLEFLKIFNRFENPKKGENEFVQYLNEMRNLSGFADDKLRRFENSYYRTIVLNKTQEEGKKLSRTPKR
jgi:hypothetical protein